MKYLKKFNESSSVLLKLSNNIDYKLISTIENLISSGKILEISCGNGADAIKLNDLGYKVYSTDYDDGYVNYVNSVIGNCIKHDTRAPFPYPNNYFNLVYSRLGLHYFTKDELENIFTDINRITKKYLVFTVKLVNDIPTGKVILTKESWNDLVSKDFNIISSKEKTGILYDNESRWLEIVAEKK